MINIDRLIDAVLEYMEAENDYMRSSKEYYRKHGYGVRIDKAETPEERHIAYAYHRQSANSDTITVLEEVLSYDTEQCNRLFSAARAARKWYEKTRYERLLPEKLKDRLLAYIG